MIRRLPSVRVLSKLLIAVAAVNTLLILALRLLRGWGVLTFWEYAVGLSAGVLVITLFLVWQGLQMAPTGFATVNEKSSSLALPYERVCELIPKVVAKNHWKLLEGDAKSGRFKARIGMSLHTFSSSFMIDVTASDGTSVNIHVLCGTRSANDPGHNDRMVAKFFNQLEKAL